MTHTLHEDLAVDLAVFLLFAEVPELRGVFVLQYSFNLTDVAFSYSKRLTISDGLLIVRHAFPVLTSPLVRGISADA